MYILPIEFATPEYDEAVRIRYKVLREPLGLDYTPEQLALEYQDIHLACFNDQATILGCLILSEGGEEVLKMRQVAVSPEWQGKGVGRKLVEASEELARQYNVHKITLNARDAAIPFYSKLAYLTVGEPFEEVGIKHLKMEKYL